MKRITLNIYNYGNITKIASFGNNSHEAVKCMKHMNAHEVQAHGYLPDKIFYFLSYTVNGRHCNYVDYDGSTDNYPNDWKYNKLIEAVRTYYPIA